MLGDVHIMINILLKLERDVWKRTRKQPSVIASRPFQI